MGSAASGQCPPSAPAFPPMDGAMGLGPWGLCRGHPLVGAAGSCPWQCGVGAGVAGPPHDPLSWPYLGWQGLQQGSACSPRAGGQWRGPTDPMGVPWGAVFAPCRGSPSGVGLRAKQQELIPAGPSSPSPGRRLASGAGGGPSWWPVSWWAAGQAGTLPTGHPVRLGGRVGPALPPSAVSRPHPLPPSR